MKSENIEFLKQDYIKSNFFQEKFGKDLKLVETSGINELTKIFLKKVKDDLNIGIVATNDAHYVLREHAPFQDILICIHTNTNVQDSKRLRMEEDSYYLKSTSEMRK